MPDPVASIQASRAVVWTRRDPRPQWLERFGPVLLALFIFATTRWGTFLLPGPPYLGDVVIGLLLANAAFAAAVRGGARGRIDPLLGTAAGALLFWVGLELLFSSFSQLALRDAAPYAYAVIAFLAFPLRDRDEEWVSRAITAALLFHAAWVTVSLLDPYFAAIPLSGGEARTFQRRPDIDTTVCGLAVVIALNRALLGRALVFNLLVAVWNTGIIFAFHTRAGLLAFAVQLAALALLTRTRVRVKASERGSAGGPRQLLRSRRARVAPALLLATALLLAPIAALQAQPVANRLAATFSTQLGAAPGAPGSGTTAARVNAWGHLAGWLLADPARTIVGVGPGPDFLEESGAAPLLLGAEAEFDARQPHNYLLNTWARLGLIGWMLVVAVLIAGARLAILVGRWSPTLRDSDVLAMMVAVSMPVPAMFGVILETPFGAIPYFWALGYLSARWGAIVRERKLSVRIGRVVSRTEATA